MEESFEIPVTYKNEEYMFSARAIKSGYSYKIEVEIAGEPVYLEPDEEGNFRLLLSQEQANANSIDHGVLRAIVDAVNSVK